MKTIRYISLLLAMLLAFSTVSMAKSAKSIENDSDKAMDKFYKEVKGAEKFLSTAKAYLVFPDVKEAGFFIGGKYAEGVLRVGNTTKAYYSITGASVGFQAGAQKYSLVIVITSDTGLRQFLLDDDEWEADMDFNIVMAEWNAEEELDDIDFGDDMVGFIFDAKGMMGNFSMEGTKFERITP